MDGIPNPVLEEYLAALSRGERVFGAVLHPEELTCLDALGLEDYDTEDSGNGKLYVKVRIKTG